MKRAKSENDDENLKKPYLSGAYIRSFVKQLASSRSSSMREKATSLERETAAVEDPPHQQPQPEPQQPQQNKKKQVRRRVQTRKPYQEKLLNMAEARREIVTALKLHRAAMKHHQQQQPPPPDFQTEQKSRRNPRIYASNSDVNYPPWPLLPAPPPLPPPAFLDFTLPSQALGLNLNLHDFITAPLSIYSSSSPSTSSSPPAAAAVDNGGGGERFEFLDCEGIRREEEREREEEMVSSPFDEVMEFPAWLNANESCLQNVDDFCFQGSVLPCMDIGEIEGMDGDWLA